MLGVLALASERPLHVGGHRDTARTGTVIGEAQSRDSVSPSPRRVRWSARSPAPSAGARRWRHQPRGGRGSSRRGGLARESGSTARPCPVAQIEDVARRIRDRVIVPGRQAVEGAAPGPAEPGSPLRDEESSFGVGHHVRPGSGWKGRVAEPDHRGPVGVELPRARCRGAGVSWPPLWRSPPRRPGRWTAAVPVPRWPPGGDAQALHEAGDGALQRAAGRGRTSFTASWRR